MAKIDLKNQVYRFVRKVPAGKVTTYGAIGDKIGSKAYRAIGQVLHKNPDWPKVPCHRVVMKDGSLASNYGMGGPKGQKKRLVREGASFINGKVDMSKYGLD